MSATEAEVRTRNMGVIMIQHRVANNSWSDVSLGEASSFKSIDDAGSAIIAHGTAGATYRIIRAYDPIQLQEIKQRKLVPA